MSQLKYNKSAEDKAGRKLSDIGRVIVTISIVLAVLIVGSIITNSFISQSKQRKVETYISKAEIAIITCKQMVKPQSDQYSLIREYENKIKKSKSLDSVRDNTNEMLTEMTAYVKGAKYTNEKLRMADLDDILGCINEIGYSYNMIKNN